MRPSGVISIDDTAWIVDGRTPVVIKRVFADESGPAFVVRVYTVTGQLAFEKGPYDGSLAVLPGQRVLLVVNVTGMIEDQAIMWIGFDGDVRRTIRLPNETMFAGLSLDKKLVFAVKELGGEPIMNALDAWSTTSGEHIGTVKLRPGEPGGMR